MISIKVSSMKVCFFRHAHLDIFADCQGTINHLSIYQSGDGKVTVAATITRPQESDGDRSTSTLANVIQIFNLTDELLKEPAQHFQSLRHDFKGELVLLRVFVKPIKIFYYSLYFHLYFCSLFLVFLFFFCLLFLPVHI